MMIKYKSCNHGNKPNWCIWTNQTLQIRRDYYFFFLMAQTNKLYFSWGRLLPWLPYRVYLWCLIEEKTDLAMNMRRFKILIAPIFPSNCWKCCILKYYCKHKFKVISCSEVKVIVYYMYISQNHYIISIQCSVTMATQYPHVSMHHIYLIESSMP